MPLFLADIPSLARLQALRPRFATLGKALVFPLPCRAEDDAEARALFPSQRPDVAQAVSLGGGHPIDLLVPCAPWRVWSPLATSRVWSGPLPRGAFVSLAPGAYACSPEFCFLLQAGRLSRAHLIRLGFELCGCYPALGRPDDPPFCSALTSVDALRHFLGEAAGAPGVGKARSALPYLKEHSASPRETELAILMGLPPRLGGYGFTEFELNARVPTSPLARGMTGSAHLLVDEYFPAARVGLEYDGMVHADTSRMARDAARRAALSSMGIEIVTVTGEQLVHWRSMDRIAELVGQKTGRRMRVQGRDHSDQRIRLHLELFGRA